MLGVMAKLTYNTFFLVLDAAREVVRGENDPDIGRLKRRRAKVQASVKQLLDEVFPESDH